MAHNLSFDDFTREYAFVNAGSDKPAWHALGQHFPDRKLTTEEAIIESHLNFPVAKAPLYARIGNKPILLPNRYTTYRTDTEVVFDANVTDQYHVLQNVEAFSFFDEVLKSDNGYVISTAGALNAGERIFITAKIDNNIIVGKDDEIERYLLLTHGHDGKSNITVMITPVRVVCNNTLNLAMRGKSSQRFTIRHTENAKERMKTAAQILGLVAAQTQEMSDLYNHLASQKFNDQQLKKFVIDVMLPPAYVGDEQISKEQFSTRFANIVDNVMSYALGNPTQQTETTRGTKFGAYNAITGYYQNVYSHKSAESKFDSIFGGTAEKNSIKALSLLLTN